MGMPSGSILVDIQLSTVEPQDWHQSACVRQNGVPGILLDGPMVVRLSSEAVGTILQALHWKF